MVISHGRQPMFRRILVPIDGSHASNVGLEEAIKMAMDQDATLCLLHVVDELSVTQNLGGARHAPASYVDEFLNALREDGEKRVLERASRGRREGVGESRGDSAHTRDQDRYGAGGNRWASRCRCHHPAGEEVAGRSYRARHAWASWPDTIGHGKRRRGRGALYEGTGVARAFTGLGATTQHAKRKTTGVYPQRRSLGRESEMRCPLKRTSAALDECMSIRGIKPSVARARAPIAPTVRTRTSSAGPDAYR